uniref:DUF4126 domain-containing protein n=1 Tax=Macrostomum lignano TaxID=282301 RepID=A0A1I8GZ34_9PLAT
WTGDVERLLLQTWQRAPDRSFIPALINVSSAGGKMLSGISASDHGYPVRGGLAISIESFLSEAGGVIGLWVGASVLTMLEFVELLVGLIAIGFNIRSAKCHAAGRADSTELVEATAAVNKAA